MIEAAARVQRAMGNMGHLLWGAPIADRFSTPYVRVDGTQ